MQPFGRNRYGPKIGGLCPFGGGELGPHLTPCGQGRAYPHAKFHLVPSNRLTTIHQRYRQTRQTGQTDRQRIDSIGRTVLQTVAQKLSRNFGLQTSLSERVLSAICRNFRVCGQFRLCLYVKIWGFAQGFPGLWGFQFRGCVFPKFSAPLSGETILM